MTKIAGRNIDLQLENFLANRAVSEAMLEPLAALVQWVKENSADYIGQFEFTALTEAQFSSLKGYSIFDESSNPIPEAQKKWVLLKGQSIVGSEYATLTGKATLPNLRGNEAHLAQALNEASLLTYQENQNRAHRHFIANTDVPYNDASGTLNNARSLSTRFSNFENIISYLFGSATNPTVARTSSEGGAVARPNRVMANIFLKINN